MKNEITIQARICMVIVRDERTGEEFSDLIALDKAQLQAAQTVGQSYKELIYRIYNRHGFRVLEIGGVRKKAVTIDLTEATLGPVQP